MSTKPNPKPDISIGDSVTVTGSGLPSWEGKVTGTQLGASCRYFDVTTVGGWTHHLVPESWIRRSGAHLPPYYPAPPMSKKEQSHARNLLEDIHWFWKVLFWFIVAAILFDMITGNVVVIHNPYDIPGPY